MKRVGNFEKVSYEQFAEAMTSLYREKFKWGEDDVELKHMYDEIVLPQRATSGSAGYDFKSPFDFTLNPGETVTIPSGIRVKIDSGWWLACVPRSGLGFKYRLQLDNSIGVIDSDYSTSDNEGHIFFRITNDSKSGKSVVVNAKDGFAQGIFIPYGITYDDDVSTARNGGMGSTGK